jgi:multisubunit Na+/H+ antiporter MnhF subunit
MNSTQALPTIRNVVYTDDKITQLAQEISEKASTLKLNLLLIGPDTQTRILPMDTLSSMAKEIWVCQSLAEVFRYHYHQQADLFVLLGELPNASAMDFKKLLMQKNRRVIEVVALGCEGQPSSGLPDRILAEMTALAEKIQTDKCLSEVAKAENKPACQFIKNNRTPLASEYENLRIALFKKLSGNPELFLQKEISKIRPK